MQRRAAAIYFTFFLVVGAAAYAYIGVAQDTHQPEFELEGETLGEGDSVSIDGTEYTIADFAEDGDLVLTLEWVDDSAVHTATLENGSTTAIEDTSYTVVIVNETDLSSFTLEEELNVSAILQGDDAVENSLAEKNDTQYVVYRENNTLRPAAEYLPEPETREFEVGDTYPYEGNETTVVEVTPEEATLEWTGPASRSAELEEGMNVTLANGDEYFAHFPSDDQVTLVPIEQYGDYATTLDEQDYFNERINGLWGIAIVAGIAALLIVSLAYIPNRG